MAHLVIHALMDKSVQVACVSRMAKTLSALNHVLRMLIVPVQLLVLDSPTEEGRVYRVLTLKKVEHLVIHVMSLQIVVQTYVSTMEKVFIAPKNAKLMMIVLKEPAV